MTPKEKALEEAAEKYQKSTVNKMAIEKIAFEKGYTECKEKMYSEEDLRNAFIEGHNVCRCVTDNTDEAKECFEEWIKTYKKDNQ